MPILIVLLLSGYLPCALAEQVYKQVGEDGVPVFSDQGSPDAERVNIEETMTFSDDLVKETMNARRLAEEQAQAESANIAYKIRITDPENDAAIRDNAGNLSISISLSPELVTGHKAALLMNGKQIRELTGSTSFALPNVDRGTHTLVVRVMDQRGKTIEESPAVNVTMLRYHLPRKQPRAN